jgi:hypothetical protein
MNLDTLMTRWKLADVGTSTDYMRPLEEFLQHPLLDAIKYQTPVTSIERMPADIIELPAGSYAQVGAQRISGPVLFPNYLYRSRATYHSRAAQKLATVYVLSNDKRHHLGMLFGAAAKPLISGGWLFWQDDAGACHAERAPKNTEQVVFGEPVATTDSSEDEST